MSILHGISAAILKNVSSVKKQASRLHKASNKVFGQQFSIEQCQEAVALSNGFKSWQEITRTSRLLSSKNDEPFWYLSTRNDFQEKMLETIIKVGLAGIPDKPLFIEGHDETAAKIGVSLWLERMSVMKTPGLLMIDTEAKTVDQTAIGETFRACDIDDEMSRFNFVDARERVLDYSVAISSRSWAKVVAKTAIHEAFIHKVSEELLSLFEVIIKSFIPAERIDQASYWCVEQAASFLGSPKEMVRFRLQDLADAGDNDSLYWMSNIEAFAANRHEIDAIRKTIALLDSSTIGTGKYLYKTSLYSPTVVLFSSNNPSSLIIAMAIYEMYTSRFHANEAKRMNDAESTPVMVYSDFGSGAMAPLSFWENSILVNASMSKVSKLFEDYSMRTTLFALADNGAISYSGRKVIINQEGAAR